MTDIGEMVDFARFLADFCKICRHILDKFDVLINDSIQLQENTIDTLVSTLKGITSSFFVSSTPLATVTN